MCSFVKRLIFSIVFCILSSVVFAQEKTQYYYNTHEKEILPDANASFQKGDYERTIELCKWHYIIVGDNAANELRIKAERCASLLQEMKSLLTDGSIEVARDVAKSLLSINPKDTFAQEIYNTPLPIPESASAGKDTASLASVVREMLYNSPVDTVSITTLSEPETVLSFEDDIMSEGPIIGEQAEEIAEQVPIKSKPSNNTVALGKKIS